MAALKGEVSALKQQLEGSAAELSRVQEESAASIRGRDAQLEKLELECVNSRHVSGPPAFILLARMSISHLETRGVDCRAFAVPRGGAALPLCCALARLG